MKGLLTMHKLRCNGCGRELPKGSLKYIVEIRTFADFDGYLEDYGDNVDHDINELLSAMEDMDAKALEEDVVKDFIYILCKRCRDRFADDPLKGGMAAFEGTDVKGRVH
ncbi:MAG: hypothetical protein HY884_05580 [Deltaproteobacteria bacterium]|nr:hypothetical protein [Deltaproteobacteria bacterium]